MNLRLSLMLLFLLPLSACATRTAPPTAPPAAPLPAVALPAQRMVATGYSFLPLDEKGWFVASSNDQQVSLVRKTSENEAYAIQTMLLELPTFQSVQDMAIWLRQEQQQDIERLPFILEKHNVWPVDFKGGDCVRSVSMATEKEPGANGISMVAEVHGLACPHPLDVHIGVYVLMTHRHDPGKQDPLLAEKAETLFKSVRFEPL